MASVLRNNMKLCRLYQKNLHMRIPPHNIFPVQNRTVRIHTGHVCLATAAYEHKFKDDALNVKSNFETSKYNGMVMKTIDAALADIDSTVRRTGRAVGKTVESVFSMAKETGVPSSAHCLYLLRACGKMSDVQPSQRAELANEIWNKYKELGCQFDVGHFNSLLKIYVENSYEFSAPEFLANMEAHKVDPNKNTYLCLLEKYCNEGNLNGASEILEYMKEKNITLNEEAFNSLIKGHVKMNDFNGAKKMLEVMRSSNLIPSADSYVALACGYAEEGDMAGIESCLQLGKNNSINFTTPHYLKIIFAASSAGQQNCVFKLLENVHNVPEYRQDFVNTALELIHRNAVDDAYELILLSSTEQYQSGANIFISQLVKCGKPTETIIRYCDDIHNKGISNPIYISAAKTAIDYHMFDCALSLLEQAHKKGTPPRVRFFWSILSHYKDKNQTEGVLSTLKIMCELGIPADKITYTNFVVPVLGNMSTDEIFSKIQETGHAVPAIVEPLFYYYCMNGKIDDALYLCKNHEVRISDDFPIREYLHIPRNNISRAYLKLLKYIFDNVGFNGDVEAIQGKFLAELISADSHVLNALLKEFGNENLTFSERSLNICRSLLRRENPALLVHLRKLENRQSSSMASMTVEDEEACLKTLRNQGAPIKPFLMDRLFRHIDQKDVDRAWHIKTLLKDQALILTPFSQVRLLKLLCASNDLEKAKLLRAELQEVHPTFKIDTLLTLDYASLLIKFSKFEEALEVLQKECKELTFISNEDNLLRNLKQFCNIVTDTRDVEFIRNVQNTLYSLKGLSLKSKNILLQPLIMVHLYRNDLESAVEDYRNCIKNYHVPVCLNMLLRKCIVAEEQGNLQKVIDITANCVGRNIALHELALAFLETGHTNQAIKVLQDLGDKVDADFIMETFKRLCRANKVLELAQILSLASDLKQIDKANMYHYVLQFYFERKDYKSCLNILERLKKESLELPPKTLELLQVVQEKTQQSLPSADLDRESFAVEDTDTLKSPNQATQQFLEYLNKKEASMALEELQRIKKGYIRSLTFSDMTQLVDLLLQEKRVMDLSPNVQAMSYIIENASEIIKPLLEKYSEAGDVETFFNVGNFLPDFTLRKLPYNAYLGKAYINSGRAEDLMNELEKHYEKKNKLFSLFAFEELLKIPEFEERVNSLALKYLEVKYDTPISCVWAHYFVQENYDKANEICKLHPIAVEKIDPKVLRTIQQEENVEMGRKFLNFIDNLNAKQRLRERAYGTLLNVLVRKGMLEEAVALVAESEKYKVSLYDNCRSVLISLKSALEKEGKTVPFQIPSEDLNLGLPVGAEESLKHP